VCERERERYDREYCLRLIRKKKCAVSVCVFEKVLLTNLRKLFLTDLKN